LVDAVEELRNAARQMLAARSAGGDALGCAPGGEDRAKGYVRACLDACVWILSERAGTEISYALARKVLRGDLDADEALRLHRQEARDVS
jgi:hypothetical protein